MYWAEVSPSSEPNKADDEIVQGRPPRVTHNYLISQIRGSRVDRTGRNVITHGGVSAQLVSHVMGWTVYYIDGNRSSCIVSVRTAFERFSSDTRDWGREMFPKHLGQKLGGGADVDPLEAK